MALTYKSKRWAPLGNMYLCVQAVVGDGSTTTYTSPHKNSTLFASCNGDGSSATTRTISYITNSTTSAATITLSGALADGQTYYITTIGY